MKKGFLLAAITALVVMLSSFTPLAESDITISIKGGELKINKLVVNKTWSLAAVKAVLGEPDRVKDGYNITHTYDQLGIVLFEAIKDKKATGTINEVQIFTERPEEPNGVTPKGNFTGTIKIENKAISTAITYQDILKKYKKWNKTDSYTEHSYRLAKKGLYVYNLFNAGETQLLKLSVGPDKR